MHLEPEAVWRSRLRNAAQTALLGLGLAVLMAVPVWLLAGASGALWVLGAVVLALALAGQMPARYVLARSGAVPVTPRQAPQLYRLLGLLYRRAGCPSRPMLFYVPSAELNAFAVGDRFEGGIAVTDGLIRALDLRQLAGVLAHEVSHLRSGDTRVMAMAAVAGQVTAWGALLLQFAVLMLLPWTLTGAVDLPWSALLVAMLAPTVSTLLQLALSRTREFAADVDAAALTGDPRGLASALQTLERLGGRWLISIFGQRSGPAREWLRTHPLTPTRISRLLALEPTSRRRPLPGLVDDPAYFDAPPPLARRWYHR